MKSLKYILITSIILAIAVWALYVFFLWDLSFLNSEINRLESKISFYEDQHIELRKVSSFVEDSEKDIDRIKELLLINSEAEIVSFIEKIETFGKQANVYLNISNLNRSERSEYRFLTADIEIVGDEISVKKVISMIESSPYRISVRDLILREEEGEWTSSLKIEVLMKD